MFNIHHRYVQYNIIYLYKYKGRYAVENNNNRELIMKNKKDVKKKSRRYFFLYVAILESIPITCEMYFVPRMNNSTHNARK